MYKNGPPSSLMRASCTDYYELITDNFITSGISTYCVIIVQPRVFMGLCTGGENRIADWGFGI